MCVLTISEKGGSVFDVPGIVECKTIIHCPKNKSTTQQLELQFTRNLSKYIFPLASCLQIYKLGIGINNHYPSLFKHRKVL